MIVNPSIGSAQKKYALSSVKKKHCYIIAMVFFNASNHDNFFGRSQNWDLDHSNYLYGSKILYGASYIHLVYVCIIFSCENCIFPFSHLIYQIFKCSKWPQNVSYPEFGKSRFFQFPSTSYNPWGNSSRLETMRNRQFSSSRCGLHKNFL